MNKQEKDFIKTLKKYTKYNLDYWDPNKFDWKQGLSVLTYHCSEYFHIWWNSDKFNWNNASWILAKYCSKYFYIWWDPEKYNLENIDILFKYCSDYMSEEIRNELTLLKLGAD